MPTSLADTLLTARSLFLLQLVTRLLTFALNQSLVRLAPPEVFGTASIQFDLISSTILFLSREGIRNALLRSKSASSSSLGLARGALPLGWVVAGIVIGVYLYASPSTTLNQPDFSLSLGMYVLASFLELGIEPLYIKTIKSDPPKLSVRVQAEGGMAIIKAVFTCASLVFQPRRALLGFAVGQLGGALWLAGRYVLEYGHEDLGFSWKGYDAETLGLAMANTRQSVVKHLLTEADRIAVGRISPLQDQGGYAIAMNYGSLVARIIFQPLEETLLLHFTSSLSSPSSRDLLIYILHLSSHLLLLLPSFLPPLLPALIPILLPRRYLATSAPSTLQTYLTWYIPLLSLNGILEAFHSSSASPAQVARQAKWMIASSGVFVGTLLLLTRLNAGAGAGYALHGITTEEALIYSSCLAMALRIVYAFRHAQQFFRSRGGLSVLDIRPNASVIGLSVASGVMLRVVKAAGRYHTARGWVELIGLGGALGLATLGVITLSERKRILGLREVLKGKKE